MLISTLLRTDLSSNNQEAYESPTHAEHPSIRPVTDLKYSILTTQNELEILKESLLELAQNASESNVFFEPWVLLPAFKSFLSKEDTACIVIEEVYPSPNQRNILGFFPLSSQTRFRGMPSNHYATLSFSHCGYLTPLIKKGYENEVFSLFLRWLDETLPHSFVELSHIIGEGHLYETLLSILHHSGRITFIAESYSRSIVSSCQKKSDFLSSLSRKKRKDILRKERQLYELGTVSCEQLSSMNNLDLWINEFLALEESGWKGKEGTAIALHKHEEHFFRTIVTEAFHRKQLLFLRLTLEGNPIAMRCGLISGNTLFSYKIAFDEQYAKYSPGVLLEIENIDVLSRRDDIHCMDSCAIPAHSLFERLWPEKKQLCSIVISSQSIFSRIQVKVLELAQKAFRWMKARTHSH